jgi:acyl-CoA synthetase (AMP-forming)/AMP-acid ligase II/NAD(P)-dependent dehydrogenase (short-subunit alcohol dehydrogenase family)
VIVSNAGLSIRRWVSASYDRFHDIERSNAVNVLGPSRLILGLLPSMRERGSGHIVNVSTVGVNLPGVEWSAYVSSKTGFDSWLRGVSPEIRADGVTTTTVYMMLVRTPMLGPSRSWRYLPGMSADEAAGMVARSIVERPRVMGAWWGRAAAPALMLTPETVERALAGYAKLANPASKPGGVLGFAIGAVGRGTRAADDLVGAAMTVAGTGAVRPLRPDRPLRALLAARRHGASPAGSGAIGAALWGGRTAVIDELGALTYDELHGQASDLAAALHARSGLGPGRRLGILCRNHRGFLHAALAGAQLGADLVPLGTDYAGPQLGAVLAREAVDVVIHDEEFAPLFGRTDFDGLRVLAWHDGVPALETVDGLIAAGGGLPRAPTPAASGRTVLLTSGSTGTPKGAPRDIGFGLGELLAMLPGGVRTLARLRPVPRAGDPLLIAPPLYHMYGYAAALAGLAAGSPLVLRRRFDAEDTLASIELHGVGILCAVPTMLARIVDLPEAVREQYDTRSLRLVPCGAAPLSPQLAEAFMDAFGDVLFNGYGSTEVGAVSLATPADLRAAPGTVGRAAPGVAIRIVDDGGRAVAPGTTGRIFVGSPQLFEGYSGGGSKEMLDGLMSIGDVGHVDRAGRLFIDGRDDEMIVSGGENVFPQEVEELLADHPSIADAGAVGVDDVQFGQRLVAFVVLAAGAPSVTEDELKEHVRDHLARYKVPREIRFVDAVPRTSTGKIQRGRLRAALT